MNLVNTPTPRRVGRHGLQLLAIAALFVAGLRQQFCTANVEGAAGTHGAGSLTKRATGAFPRTHLLCKKGADVMHADICGASDYPIGLTNDAPDNAEDLFNVFPLSAATGTRKVAVGSGLLDNIALYTAANGLAQGEPSVAGVYYKIGHAVDAAVQDSAGNWTQEFAPQNPVKLTVAATPSSVANIAAAFTTGPGLVKFL